MPRFFDTLTLTDAQRSRWDAAKTEYQRVMTMNADKSVAAMTAETVARSLEECGLAPDAGAVALRDWMLRFSSLACGNDVGSEKSALFARLLEGKAALAIPPPTSYSYPWYEVIEAPGPFPIHLGGVLGPQFDPCKLPRTRAVIDQCSWEVTHANEAAKRLMALQVLIDAIGRPPKDGASSTRYEWTPDLLKDLREAYAQKPEFTVKFLDWPEYRLFVGRGTIQSQRQLAQEMSLAGQTHDVAQLRGVGSVYELVRLQMNSEIGEVVWHAVHPRAALEAAKLEASKRADGAEYAFHDRFAIDAMSATLESDIAVHEANPSANDFVVVTQDAWVLAKVA